jgi:aryl-alcohol dehydrogenase-like predicted oxidoreductase
MSHRKDVEFLEECNPALVERNADEFKRIRDMLTEVDGPAERAEKKTHWHSDGSKHYEARVAEARKLLTGLAEGYGILAAVVAFGWYAAQPVYPACTVYSGAHLPVNASAAGVDAAARQAYEKALADGAT